MSYCTKCGNEISGDDLFCKACGAKQDISTTAKNSEIYVTPAANEQTIEKLTDVTPVTFSSVSAPEPRMSPKKNPNMPVTILSVFLAVAVIAAGFLGYKYIDDSNTINTQQETISGLNADKSSLQSDLSAAQSTIQDVNGQLSSTQSQLATAEEDLAAIQAKYPLRNFESLNKLQLWASSHKQTDYNYADDQYATALAIQQAAMEDGYLVSACISWGHATGYSYVICEAMVGTTVYYWFPQDGIVKIYMADIPVD
ncbi:zinc ribbon domain-containing protein [Dehalococcoides mccartyi]|jgi:hypothetical protein|uniref:zinc ribbon domain-containing protein n=2 Tax=Dehalococcoides mccartyi TaxID=61435 RepID=UPI0003C842AE|nr:zinc ribbon domain-containing protein [Dehalococcoides mccartyi]AHB13617.1 hypothetical protein GY50_0837 [Dehalococcoides mccartyi GY50]